ncbi:MAG: translation initiation factor IF-2 [Candidatus Woesearchaeota archaeon]|nr:MAG: translation initiation factor IF-2 [Candidatus Woesearchaeota archaeon]
MASRAPIVSVLGHVDHGKSSILDAIRGTNIIAGEAGGITQAIGASIIPIHTIKKMCGALLDTLHMDFTIPGVLFVDTPGHAAFTSLRKRGGALADIAILVIDINEGFRPQTKEAIEILKNAKTPFLIAANKLDLLGGFRKTDSSCLASIAKQTPEVQQKIEEKLYLLVGSLYDEFGLQADRFDRVDDYTQKIAIIPVSAKEHIGLQELLMILTGLAQKFLEQNLLVSLKGPAKGTIVEVKEEKGLGKTVDVIIYDGTLRVGEKVLIGTLSGVKTCKVRSLFEPNPLHDMRDKHSKYRPVKEVTAATGVKLSSPDFDDSIIAGLPIRGFTNDEDAIRESIEQEMSEASIITDQTGIVVKADTLGSLEAIAKLFSEKGFSIKKAEVGDISKKDFADAEANFDESPQEAVIIGFNVKATESTDRVKVITGGVIYKLLDDLELWVKEQEEAQKARELDGVTKPFMLEVLQNSCIRASNPLIVGIEVIRGTLRSGTRLISEKGEERGVVKSIQSNRENVHAAERGRQVAISIPAMTFNRQICEEHLLFSDLSESEFRKLKDLQRFLTGEEKEVLKRIAEIKRQDNPVWGV